MSLEKRIRSEKEESIVNVATIGQQGHGKSTLTAALTQVLSRTYQTKAYGVDYVNDAQEENQNGVTAHIKHVDYKTLHRHYQHIDYPTHADYVKDMISSAVQMDAAILVVSAADGPMQETRAQVELSHQMGVSSIIVFLNKYDMVDDAELLELVEMETRGLLISYGFPGDDLPVIRGSALRALESDLA
ncbi:hypothetical protein I4U23_015928 [Adineta vaga]|nr:hypothetical protein I4U23_015928 [Adineta vaga]